MQQQYAPTNFESPASLTAWKNKCFPNKIAHSYYSSTWEPPTEEEIREWLDGLEIVEIDICDADLNSKRFVSNRGYAEVCIKGRKTHIGHKLYDVGLFNICTDGRSSGNGSHLVRFSPVCRGFNRSWLPAKLKLANPSKLSNRTLFVETKQTGHNCAICGVRIIKNEKVGVSKGRGDDKYFHGHCLVRLGARIIADDYNSADPDSMELVRDEVSELVNKAVIEQFTGMKCD